MDVYRIVKERYAKDLSGTGARMAGGRWNRKGVPVVYASESRALAMVEFLVHIPFAIAPGNLVLVTIDIPDRTQARTIAASELPSDWRDYPAPGELAEIGSRWVDKNDTVLLHVPSAIVEHERNTILNPAHPDFKNISIAGIEPIRLDKRLLQ
jgi:RES domain-containing protein